MVGAHALRRKAQGIALRRRDVVKGLFQRILVQLERAHGRGPNRVKTRRVVEYGRITTSCHVGQDFRHALLYRRVHRTRPMQPCAELGLESAAGGGKPRR